MDSRFVRYDFESSLGHIIEECGEVVAAAGKIVRFGPLSYNPLLPKDEQETNIVWLIRELADLKPAIDRLEAAIDKKFPRR